MECYAPNRQNVRSKRVKYCCNGVYAFTRFLCVVQFFLFILVPHTEWVEGYGARLLWLLLDFVAVVALSSVLNWHTERKADKLAGICFCWIPLSPNFQPRMYFCKIVCLWFLTWIILLITRFSRESCRVDALLSSQTPRVAVIRESIAPGVALAFLIPISLRVLKEHDFVA